MALSWPVAARSQTVGLTAERIRLAEITGDTMHVALTSFLTPLRIVRPMARLPLTTIGPAVHVTWNSAIPYSMNDGPLWAGRGFNFSVTGGLRYVQPYHGATITATVAPTLAYSRNLPFQVIPGTTPGRSAYSNPFHGRAASADLPLRFGDRPLLGVAPGRTALDVRTRRIAVGVTAANEWWGPAIRNTLVMSSNAPGVPRLYVSTPGVVRTPAGAVDAKIIAGTLTESRFFDRTPGNDYRAVSGLLARLHPAFDSTLTFGLARVVYSSVGPYDSPFLSTLSHGLDALARWEHITSPADTTPSGASRQHSDQILSLFARWIFPDAGFEVYGEWARMDLPRTVTELLVAAHHTGGYTLGFQWAQPRRRHDYLRLQSEVTYLEQSLVFPDRPPPDYYTGRASPQGYTQRGQVIGAAIGPGASSQWIAIDWLAPGWQAGWYVGRVRWENDALYRLDVPTLFKHDITVLTGLRGGWRTKWTDFLVDATFGYRLNYLFQNGFANYGGFRTVDVRNFTISLTASPR